MLSLARPGQDFLSNWPDNVSMLGAACWHVHILCCCFTCLMFIIAIIQMTPQVGVSAAATSSLSRPSAFTIIGTAMHQSSALPFIVYKKVRFFSWIEEDYQEA